MASNSVTQARLRELLHYDPLTGFFTRRATTGHRGQWKAGEIAGSKGKDGYIRIWVDCKSYQAGRLAFLYMTGAWPKVEADHKDSNTSNNIWLNLRDATKSQNQQNLRRARSHNILGVLGVSEYRGRFCARIKVDGIKHSLGTFDTPELAHAAYIEAKRRLHPAGML